MNKSAESAIQQIRIQINDHNTIQCQLFDKITTEIEIMNKDYHEYMVFCRTAKQHFINYYPIIVNELFEAIEFIKTLKDSFTKKEKKEINKIMRTIKTLDIGMFVEYTQKGTAFKSSNINVTELHEIEERLKEEIQNVKRIPVSTWKEIRW